MFKNLHFISIEDLNVDKMLMNYNYNLASFLGTYLALSGGFG